MIVDAKKKKILVYFFGDHERAWVDMKNCVLYSANYPAKKLPKVANNFEEAIREMNHHIDRLSSKFGEFVYAPVGTRYDPTREEEYLKLMLPNIEHHERITETGAKVQGLLDERKPVIIPLVDNTQANETLKSNGSKDLIPVVQVKKLQVPKSIMKRRQTMAVPDSFVLEGHKAKKVRFAETKGLALEQQKTATKHVRVMQEVASSSAGPQNKAIGKRRMTCDQTSWNANQSPVQPTCRSVRIKPATPVVPHEVAQLEPHLPHNSLTVSHVSSSVRGKSCVNDLSLRVAEAITKDLVAQVAQVVTNVIAGPIHDLEDEVEKIKENQENHARDMDSIQARLGALENREHHG